MKDKQWFKNIIMLQGVFLIYSINSIVAKLASDRAPFSVPFLMLYGLELVILGIYAILWQQVIKKFELSVAYANKAVKFIWGMLWGILIFKEQITIAKVTGILLVVAGIVVLNSGKEQKV